MPRKKVQNKRGRPTNYDLITRGELYKLASDYLLENWQGFDDKTKLKISLQIADKILPQRIESTNLNINKQETSILIAETVREQIKQQEKDHLNRLNTINIDE